MVGSRICFWTARDSYFWNNLISRNMYFNQLVFLYDVELTVNSKFLRIATLDPILYRISMMAMKFLDLTHPHDLTKLIQKTGLSS